jgi:hypothetical protein
MAFQGDGAFHVTAFQVVGVSDWVEQLKRIRAKAGVAFFFEFDGMHRKLSGQWGRIAKDLLELDGAA